MDLKEKLDIIEKIEINADDFGLPELEYFNFDGYGNMFNQNKDYFPFDGYYSTADCSTINVPYIQYGFNSNSPTYYHSTFIVRPIFCDQILYSSLNLYELQCPACYRQHKIMVVDICEIPTIACACGAKLIIEA